MVSVEGEVFGDDFVEKAKLARAQEGRSFDAKRFFCDDDELVHVGGRTYAFSSQWSGENWFEGMTELCTAFPDEKITFAPST